MPKAKFKLNNVLLGMNERTRVYPEMLYRAESPVDYSEEDGSLAFEGTVGFLTYFNSLSCRKWRQYTNAGPLWLHLELAGDPCGVEMTGVREVDVPADMAPDPLGDPVSSEIKCEISETSSGVTARFEGSSDFQTVEVPVKDDGLVLVGFNLHSKGVTALRNAYWFTEVDESAIRPIKLALATTTFMKEQYVVSNIEAVKREVLGSDDAIASSFHMYVIDNGSTLDAAALSDDGVTVIPNANVGGAGGFARGMIAAIEGENVPSGFDFTHVLLMDDDVTVFPESFKRTFNLLSLARGEYKDAFINGAMLQAHRPNAQFEDVAHVLKSGAYQRVKGYLFMDTLADVAMNEVVDVEVPGAYGAWWYSCIPVSAIKENGLPLPVFFRCDDVEYGMRCKPTYMTMNGICVWHDAFDDRFRASVDGYQYMRNFPIVMASSGNVNLTPHMLRAARMTLIFIRSLGYETAELILDGLEDYMKGPSVIMEPNGERIFKENNARCENLLPLDEALAVAIQEHPELAEKLKGFQPDMNMLRTNVPLPITKSLRLFRTLPYDKHILPDAFLSDEPGTAYYGAPSSLPGIDQVARRVIVACGRDGSRAHVRVMDKERERDIRNRLIAVFGDYMKNGKKVEAAYKAAVPELTSVEFWKEYLKRANEA